MGQRLDSRGVFPSGFQDYVELYGFHFSKKACQFAIGKMRKKNPQTGKEEPVEMKTKEQVEEFLKKYGVAIDKAEGYDMVYIYHMACADYMKSSIVDEAHLALFLKDYFQDIDSYSERAFTNYYSDCIGKGTVLNWEDLV